MPSIQWEDGIRPSTSGIRPRGTWSANQGNRFEAKASLRNVGSRGDDFSALSRGPGCYRAAGLDTTLAIRNSRCVPSVRGGGFTNAIRPLSEPSMEFKNTAPGCYIGSWSSFVQKDAVSKCMHTAPV